MRRLLKKYGVATAIGLAALGLVVVMARDVAKAYAASDAPKVSNQANDSSPFLFGPFLWSPATLPAKGPVLFKAGLNATDYFPIVRSARGFPMVQVVVTLPKGSRPLKTAVVLVGKLPWDKPLSKANRQVARFRDKRGLWHVRWRYLNLQLAPPVPSLRIMVSVPAGAQKVCVTAVASVYGAGKDRLGRPAKPMRDQACATAASTATTATATTSP